ncbi:WD40/YVTN/BNR-like repeat-containing protein [Halococcus salifodinae]|uniref:Glycosyl hydrolase n=1 Tax=Halococcus salifodinae DSM 8989 TaxID=1227456 RepID=M0MZN2_9EURY|nr:hypothetical protein [Halococcus salifodinae]EMA51051.1 hypothetical protein C450_12980 [Halococcus salifodinae DSM 8989]
MPTIHAAMRNGLLVAVRDDVAEHDGATTDGVVSDGAVPGDAWRTTRRLAEHDLECVAVHPASPDRVFVSTFDAGLHRSEDGGESFERVGQGTIGEHVMSLAVDPESPETVWAGTEPSAVYRSTDGGVSWEHREGLTDLPSSSEWSFPPRPDTHHVRWIEPDPHDSGHLYVGIEAGALIETHDAGETWEDRVETARVDNHSLTTHPDAPERAWSAAGDGYAETHDAGETWVHPQEGLDHRYCWSVAVDPADPDTVLLSSASGPRSAHNTDTAESYVYRKRGDSPTATGGGVSWERLDDRGLPTGEGVVRAVLAPGAAAGEFYAVNNRGLFFTTDAGDSWTRLGVEWPAAFESQTPRGLAVLA